MLTKIAIKNTINSKSSKLYTLPNINECRPSCCNKTNND